MADGKPVYVENKTLIAESVFDSYFYTNNNKPLAYPMRLIDKSFLKLRDITIAYTLTCKMDHTDTCKQPDAFSCMAETFCCGCQSKMHI